MVFAKVFFKLGLFATSFIGLNGVFEMLILTLMLKKVGVAGVELDTTSLLLAPRKQGPHVPKYVEFVPTARPFPFKSSVHKLSTLPVLPV